MWGLGVACQCVIRVGRIALARTREAVEMPRGWAGKRRFSGASRLRLKATRPPGLRVIRPAISRTASAWAMARGGWPVSRIS
jgi:hypothetical protein